MKNNEIKDKFIELRAQGYSYDNIAKELNVSKQTLINWSKEFQIEILNLRAISLEALQEKYFLTKEKKIEFMGELIRKLKAEADKRDLTKLTDRELFELILKFSERLDKELLPVSFKKERTESFLELDTSVTSIDEWQG